MNDWLRLQVPSFCERLIGFSVPQDDEVLVISYEGVHLIRLGREMTVETDEEFAEYDIYDSEMGLARYRGREYQIIGLHRGTPLLQGRDGERLVLNAVSQELRIVRGEETLFSMQYENFSGDWAAATFSPDGRYI